MMHMEDFIKHLEINKKKRNKLIENRQKKWTSLYIRRNVNKWPVNPWKTYRTSLVNVKSCTFKQLEVNFSSKKLAKIKIKMLAVLQGNKYFFFFNTTCGHVNCCNFSRGIFGNTEEKPWNCTVLWPIFHL